MMKFRIPSGNWFKIFLLILIVSFAGAGGWQIYIKNFSKVTSKVNVEKNTPRAFVSEIYDKIKENYWNNISDTDLLDFFGLSIEKNGKSMTKAKFENKDKFLDGLIKATEGMDETQRNNFIVAVVNSVLVTLAPSGRSGLYTTKQEESLKNVVQNINPEKDLYKDLGLQKGASVAAVEQAYKKEAEKLAGESSPAAQEKIKQITYAKETLSQNNTKSNYDQNKIEPTIFTKIPFPGILYLQFKKFSPTSFDEFQQAFESHKDDPNLYGLILDLRGNIGGAIDATAYFMGLFLGKNQYAFDFYHKGEFLPFKTQTDKLASILKYKQIVVLIDNQTQSSAEMMASSLKKYHIGVLVGTTTKGWGTVERIFPLENQISKTEKYSLFLVHSITVRDDNQPIEGRGVDPNININDPNWQQELLQYFNNQNLINAIEDIS